jgi:diguanylate cyclase (GGDEF)-like protein
VRRYAHQSATRTTTLRFPFTTRSRAAALWLIYAALIVLLVVTQNTFARVTLGIGAAAVTTVMWRSLRRDRVVVSDGASTGMLMSHEARVLEQAMDGVRSALAAERTVLWRLSPAGESAQPWIVRGGVFPPPISLAGDVIGWAAHQGVSLRSEAKPPWGADGVSATAVTAVRSSSSMAVLTVEYPDARSLPALPDLERAAAYLAAFIDLEAERSASVTQRQRLDGLIQVLRRLPAEIEPRPLAQQLAASAIDLTGAAGAAVAEWNGDSGRVLAVAGMGSEPALDLTFAANESETAIAARGSSAIVRAHRPRGSLPVVAAKERFATPARSLAALPLSAGGQVVGVLTVWSPEEVIDGAAIESLEALAPYAALQFRHAQAFGQMRERADHDRLTGLRNREAFETELEAEFARYDRYARPFALLLIDIDHFKDVNDRYGHPVGDAVLATLGRLLTKTLREVDVAGRYGGEEFAVLLPETGPDKGIEIAERLRVAIAGATTQTQGLQLSVTASIGVSAIPAHATDPQTLIRTADAALYASKRSGRNRVTAASELT